MAAQATARTARRHTDTGRSRRRPTRAALPTHAVHFDGRDVTEPVAPKLAVRQREVALCRHCGTIRDARFSFCCEFVAIWDDSEHAATAALPMPQALAPARREAAVSAA